MIAGGRLPGMPNVHKPLSTRARGEESLRTRRLLMHHVSELIRNRGLNQVQAAKWLGVTQPRISQLLNGQAHRFSTDTLLDILGAAGVRVLVDFRLLESRQSSAATPVLQASDRPPAV